MRWSRVADYCFRALKVAASRPGRKVRKSARFPHEKFSNYFLAKYLFGVETDCSLKRMNVVHPSSQSNVWEPGENPGRLRHCNGYKFPKCHRSESGRREGGLRPKSGYRFGCARLVEAVES